MPTSSVTPMMSQFLKIKSQYTDALLFYRMGDFYELFFEDAEIASSALNITLTKRGKFNGQDIPMCGVPFHSSENYLLNLIRKGHKVAVCEQLEKPEDAKKRGYKAVVKRDVVRLITPGTLTEEGLLSDDQNNFLLSCFKNETDFGVAWTDISTGEFYCSTVNDDTLLSLLNRISPSEILVVDSFQETVSQLNLSNNIIISPLPPQNFDPAIGKKRLESFFNIKTIKVFGTFTKSEVSAMAAVLSYLEITQCTQSIPLIPPVKETNSNYMKIDVASRQSLEITKTLSGQLVGSLLASINHTLTSGGSRLLQDRLNCPSINVEEILLRQESVSFFINNQSVMVKCREILKQTPDMQRSLSRLGLGRGNPKDLSIVRNCLRSIKKIQTLLLDIKTPPNLLNLIKRFEGFANLLKLLDSALVEDPPASKKGDIVISSNYNESLKEFRELKHKAQTFIINLQVKYIDMTNVSSLKIKFNNVLGYFVETPISHSKKMSSDILSEIFIHRQTTTNCSRFSSLELSELASNIINAQEKVDELEHTFLKQLTDSVIKKLYILNSAAIALSEFDFYSSLSFQSISNDWVKPAIDKSKTFIIKAGRHPVVELALRNTGSDSFVANDSNLNPNGNSILLLTGPNMAGKSTYLRQNALITILAQIGSYVPAQEAHIGVVDQIFSRVGASDDLSKGNSTFMVEMIETASILKHATDSALIIMDEIGRGTSTYDGLSIAWATLEHIHDVIKCRTLFATHYHELTQLQNKFPNIKNAKVSIREWRDEVIFLHQVEFGTADKSYGIHVAKLAGLPTIVTNRAKTILKTLENNSSSTHSISNKPRNNVNQETKETNKILDMLISLNPDEITPRQALDIISEAVSRIKAIN
ncbi:MAG: DNA mismatch repair protein MutS [Paracoccaceae bacterium]|nr:DNA mismatch repair protein MutS [Paracoccaceae bacterium]